MYFMLPHSKALYIYMLFSSSFFLPLISSSSSSFLSFFYVVLAASYSAMIKLQCPFLLGEKIKKKRPESFLPFWQNGRNMGGTTLERYMCISLL